jgi:hypothetical protein
VDDRLDHEQVDLVRQRLRGQRGIPQRRAVLVEQRGVAGRCPGRKPPFSAVNSQ